MTEIPSLRVLQGRGNPVYSIMIEFIALDHFAALVMTILYLQAQCR